MCNQAAGLSRCLSKVQQDLSSHLKIIQTEHSKGKSADKVGSATQELQYLTFQLLHLPVYGENDFRHCFKESRRHLKGCIHGAEDLIAPTGGGWVGATLGA